MLYIVFKNSGCLVDVTARVSRVENIRSRKIPEQYTQLFVNTYSISTGQCEGEQNPRLHVTLGRFLIGQRTKGSIINFYPQDF